MSLELRLSTLILFKIWSFNWSFFDRLPVKFSKQLMISILYISLVFCCSLSLLKFSNILLIVIKFSFDDLLESITVLLVTSMILLFFISYCLFFMGGWFFSVLDRWILWDIFLAAHSIKIVLELHGHILVLWIKTGICSVQVYHEREIPRSLTRSAHA